MVSDKTVKNVKAQVIAYNKSYVDDKQIASKVDWLNVL